MSYDETIASPDEKRAILLLATMYDGGQRSVSSEEFGAAIGARGEGFESLLARMSQANLIRYRSGEGFTLTAMIVDAAERINHSPSLSIPGSVYKLAGQSKAVLLVILLFAAACGVLFLAARKAILDPPPPRIRPPAVGALKVVVGQIALNDAAQQRSSAGATLR